MYIDCHCFLKGTRCVTFVFHFDFSQHHTSLKLRHHAVMIRLAARLTLASNAPQVPLLLFGASFVVRAVHCLNDSIVWFWVNFFVPWLWEVFHSIIHNDLSLLHAILVLSQTVCCVVIISSLFISPVELNSISSLQSYSYLVFSVFVFILSHRTKLPKLRHTYCNRDHTFYVIVIL